LEPRSLIVTAAPVDGRRETKSLTDNDQERLLPTKIYLVFYLLIK